MAARQIRRRLMEHTKSTVAFEEARQYIPGM